ncbi:MAG: methyltransferase domain-containing protein [Candidatus Pristimantibacillus lignocellulolyticus]|uniref:Methyltransferase domain-containing protein n=1 Tax=Candidatus Pristimantibacillus lignocellulolyticus TaxID=2994561 RepID=A0A9J6ZCS3_9BACL|nr:MAG: methyltransferase domain-containing protein [Candidatus Pristimantibacillus lignocellulolyticus]
MQDKQTTINSKAWNTKAYEAWTIQFGHPEAQAEKLKLNGKHKLRRWIKYIGDPNGMRIINLLGSAGSKAIPLALLGADVTIVDISKENQKYASEVARYANVKLNYILSDVLNIPAENNLRNYDLVLMEFGVLHYFSNLEPIFELVNNLLRNNGRLILTDFHPFTSKSSNYFDSNLVEEKIAFSDILSEEDRKDLPKVLLRKWTMGEILSTLAEKNMILRKLEEEPHHINSGVPAFYTIVADKINEHQSPLIP